MSIIYDALKKIEKNVNKAYPDGGAHDVKKNGQIKKSNPLLVITLLVLSVIFIARTVVYVIKNRVTSNPEVSQPLVVQPIPEPVDSVTEEETVQLPEEPVLALTGVYFQGNQGYALINNRIVKAGDTIQNATVKEIGLEKVTLDFEGRVITLVNTSR